MSSNVNGCFEVAFVLVLVLVLGDGVCAKSELAIAKLRVRIFQCIGVSPLNAQTPAEPVSVQTRLSSDIDASAATAFGSYTLPVGENDYRQDNQV